MNEGDQTTASGREALEVRAERLAHRIRPLVLHLWLDRRRLVLGNGFVISVALVVLLFFVPPYFDSSVLILPEFGETPTGVLSQLSGLASLSGLAGLSFGRGLAPEVYDNLLRSESVLAPVLVAEYETEAFPTAVSLLDYFEVEPDETVPPTLRERERMLEFMETFLSTNMSVGIDRVSGIVSVRVRMPESRLSAEVVNRVAASLDQYVVKRNRERARETMEYIEGRLLEAEGALRDSEEHLKEFHARNRVIAAPQLLLEQSRLERDVERRQAIYLELDRQYEVARIEQYRETPFVNFREDAKEPVEKSGPKRSVLMIAIALSSGIITCLLSYYEGVLRRLGATLTKPSPA